MELEKERWARERREWLAADKAGRRRIEKRQWIRKRRASEGDPVISFKSTKSQLAIFENLRRSLPGKPTRQVLLRDLFDFALSHASASLGK